MKTYEEFLIEQNNSYLPCTYFDEKFKIFELLKHSLSSEKVESILAEYVKDVDIDEYVSIINHQDPDDYLDTLISSDKNSDTVEFVIKYDNSYPLKYIEIIISKIYASGWYIALLYIDNKKSLNIKEFIKNIKQIQFKSLSLLCERRYPIEGVIYTNDILYHLTTMGKLDKIKKEGLNPKNSGIKKAYHPKRIYFCKDMNCINNFLLNLKEAPSKFTKYRDAEEKYAIISIDPSKLTYNTPTGTEQIYFFNDYRKKDSLYTNFNIKPIDISIIKEYI